MKVVAFNSSPRKDGNTTILIKLVLDELENQGIETEFVDLAGKKITGCRACFKCVENKNQRCSVTNDIVNECIEKMLAAEGIILGSPTYFADINADMKALIDRAGMVAKANGDMFRRKLGAAVIPMRRAGSVHAFDSINHFFTINQMIIPGSSYWNVGVGRQIGDVNSDTEGLDTMKTLGENFAWLLKKIYTSEDSGG